MTSIEDLRKKINELDESIIQKLADRKDLVMEIGRIKAQQNTAVLDNKREQELARLYEQLADKYQLQPAFIKQVFEIIIAHSRELQKNTH